MVDWINLGTAEMNTKMVVVVTMLLLIFSINMECVKPEASDCYDACSTACVNPNTRLMLRCDRKCQIRCSPGLDTGGHSK